MSDQFADFPGHPVEQDNYVLATRAIIELELQIREWVKRKVRGAIVCGRPRLGKTRAIRHLKEHVKTLFGREIAVFVLSCGQEDFGSTTDKAFYTDFLAAVGYGLPHVGQRADKQHRLIEFMKSEALRIGDRKILLIVDEAQNLSSRQLGHLVTIHNALENDGFLLYTYQFGQPELRYRKTALRVANKNQILARFMASEYQFRGIRDKQDVRFALTRYDDPSASEFPEGSGTSYTEYFFPNAYRKGWRLSQLTDLIFEGFQKTRVQLQVDRAADIPMAPFTAVVDAILTEWACSSDRPPNVTEDTVARLLDEVAYEGYELALMANSGT